MTMDDEPIDLQDAPHHVPLRELVSGLAGMTGDIPPHAVPSSCRTGLLNNAPTWERLGASTIGEVLAWPGIGPGRAGHILRFAARAGEFRPAGRGGEGHRGLARSEADEAFGLVAAWAVHRGVTTGLEDALRSARQPGTPPSVVAAADRLETIDLEAIALSPDERSFDHHRAANDLLASFEGRDAVVLERVLAVGLRPVPTLEEIGERFGVTRERVRQLQGPVERKLTHLLRTPDFDVLLGHADVLSAEVGVACPVGHLPEELKPGASLADELFAYLAGPFRLADGWLIRRDLGAGPREFALRVFDTVVDGDGIVAADALFDALSSFGVSPRWHALLMDSVDRIALLDGHYVRWGGHVERLTSMLAVAGRPMTNDELAAQARSIEPEINVRGMQNRLVDDGFRRVGIGRYALSAWDSEDFRGIVAEMETVLAHGPAVISDLAVDLEERFGASKVSVTMYATMHPRFVAADGRVRLRRDDEPYEVTSTLEESARCYQIDGAWAWRVPVDHDLLRGSGRAIPEAFAAHLGASPTNPVDLMAGEHEVKIRWTQTSQVGSLRRRAEELGLVEGDWMFMRHSSTSGVSFLPLPGWKLQTTTPDERVRLLVGGYEDDQRDLAMCLADALGIPGSSVDLAECRRVLQERGEADVLNVLAQVR